VAEISETRLKAKINKKNFEPFWFSQSICWQQKLDRHCCRAPPCCCSQAGRDSNGSRNFPFRPASCEQVLWFWLLLKPTHESDRLRGFANAGECWLRLSLTFERDAIHQRNHSCQFQHELFKGFLMTRFWSFHSVFSLCYRVGAMPWRLLSCKGRCHVGVEWIFKIVQYKLWGSLRSWKHGRN